MDRNTGTYQISFKNLECDKLEDVAIGVLPITKNYKEGNILNREYGMNFAGHQLVFKQLFTLDQNQISKKQKQTDQYKNYITFARIHKTFATPKDSTLTIRLNTRDRTMIFFVNSTPMHYICDIKESDFPCKFFVYTKGTNAIVRMTRYKHINRY
jgi:hypothetical protein